MVSVISLFLFGCAARGGVRHEVQEGQTLWRIARVYDVKLAVLMDVNNIKNPRDLKAGTTILIPGAERTRQVPVTAPRAARRSNSSDGTQSPSSREEPSVTIDSNGGAESGDPGARSGTASISQSNPVTKRAESLPSDFNPVWPCNGRVISQFDRNNFPTHRGIRIKTKKGSPVRAAEQGNIKLAGNFDAMPGFGKIVIIFHGHDFQTVYAHLKTLRVSEGEAVDRNETIGTAGSTGKVERPVCYFEIRYKVKPHDPMIFLGEKS